MHRAQRLAAPLLALFVLGVGSGCTSLAAGEHQTDAYFEVYPKSDGTFLGWTEITLTEDAEAVDGATLVAVDLEAAGSTADLGFLKAVRCEAVTADERVALAEGDAFGEGVVSAPLDVLYEEDLRPLFDEERTIRIEWIGTVDPAAEPPPEEGYQVDVSLLIDIDA